MRNNLLIGLFLCLACVQIITPLSMITNRESILKSGAQFKFKTEPVDPYDAFRGRYVALRIQGNNAPAPKGVKLNSGQNVYALISNDEQGFAKITSLTTSRPAGSPYILAKVRYIAGERVVLDLPIDRYYMEEKSAPKAERLYREYSRRGNEDAYVVIRVKNGLVVIEALYVGGKRIEDAVKEDKK